MQEVFEKIIEKLSNIGWVFGEYYPDGTNISRASKKSVPYDEVVEIVKQVAAEYNNGWIPVKYHEITDEERKENCLSDDIAYYLDCKLPEDEEEILITRKWKDRYIVEHDMCMVDGEYSLESGLDWIEIIAWQPLPEPYQPKGDTYE